jgi:hypothetical protein
MVPSMSMTPVTNLPPVSTTIAKLVAKFAASAVAILPTVLLTPLATIPAANLLPVHLDLRISPRMFDKIQNGPNEILWGWGEIDSCKKT